MATPLRLAVLLLGASTSTDGVTSSSATPTTPWLSIDGKEWQICEEMQPLNQRCLLPNFTTANFGCDVQLLEAEWNRSGTPAILDLYSCRPCKIWENTNMALAPAFHGGPHNPNNLSGLVPGWRSRLHGCDFRSFPSFFNGFQ